jgi:hypothetical protein
MWRQIHCQIAMGLACAIGLALGSTHLIAAQDATPTTAELSCTVPPRDTAFFETIQGTPVVPDANHEALIEAYRASTQYPESAHAVAVQAAIDMFDACANSGDFARLASLFSDSFWHREVRDVPARAEAFQSEVEASPSPIPAAQQMESITIGEIRELPDGRLAILVRFEIPQADDGEIQLIIFTRMGDRWLIDEVILGVDDDLATPTTDERVRY